METDHTIVQDAETLFLTGNFRKSLLLCNKLLENPEPSPKTIKGVKTIQLETPLQLSIDAANKIRTITVEIDFTADKQRRNTEDDDNDNQRISLVDRAATVALQSWYEIARRLNEKKKNNNNVKNSAEQGYVHLLPFLELYAPERISSREERRRNQQQEQFSSSVSRAMPLELAVIFVQFLRTIGLEHIHDSVELGCEILCQTIGASRNHRKAIPGYVKESCEELMTVLFVEILPWSSSAQVIDNILNRFWEEKSWSPPTWHLQIDSGHCNTDVVRKLLSFLKKPPKYWTRHAFPNEDCIQSCRRSLKRQLKLQERKVAQDLGSSYSATEQQRTSVDPTSHTSEVSEMVGMTSSTESSETHPSSYSSHLVQQLLKLRGHKDALIQKLTRHKSALIFALLMLLISWKRRQRLVYLSSTAVRLFLAPIREIVDAITQPPR